MAAVLIKLLNTRVLDGANNIVMIKIVFELVELKMWRLSSYGIIKTSNYPLERSDVCCYSQEIKNKISERSFLESEDLTDISSFPDGPVSWFKMQKKRE